jgi:hypothetical protein
MDIIGVTGVAAEAELLCAIVTFFKRVGYTSNQITIRVNSRKVVTNQYCSGLFINCVGFTICFGQIKSYRRQVHAHMYCH